MAKACYKDDSLGWLVVPSAAPIHVDPQISLSGVQILSDVTLPRPRLIRGMLIAVALWLFYLVATGYTSAATLLSRVDQTDVMRAASGGIWSGRIAWEIGTFAFTLFVLHLLFAAFTWVLASATAVFLPLAREKFGRVVVGWFSLLAGAVLIYNALWYPRTLIGAYYHDAVSTSIGLVQIGQAAYWAVAALCAYVLLRAAFVVLFRSPRRMLRQIAAAGSVAAILIAIAATWSGVRPVLATAVPLDRPHIIVLGIDSLRLEQLQRFGGTGVTPNLDRFLKQADVFKDTTTPAARTFSSWTAILTGRSPTITGARFNLAERSSVRANPTFADLLQDLGYQTIYSTDEVRFANIDQSYGFDKLVTPRIGASDFLIGTYNELPLSSLIINTRVGEWFFPFSNANRGVATMFQPESYLERVRREVSFDRPTLFVSHLTAAHWPYYISDTPFGIDKRTHEHDRPVYRVGLQTADAMFGSMMEILKSKGALRNALVIVLSDHGEALSLPSDSFFDETFRVEGLRAPLKMLDYGHGQSVLSRSQYEVLLAFKSFGGDPPFEHAGRDVPFLATVEDVAPTILEFVGVSGDPLVTSGQSLLPILRDSADSTLGGIDRVRYTETDLSVLPAPGGGIDEVATARQNSRFFEVDPDTARLQIQPKYAPLVTTYKERAAFSKDQLLAAIPAGPYAHQYVFFDFPRHHGRVLLERPSDDDPDAQRLWDALFAHYQSELQKAVSITPEDWTRIDQEWTNFIQVRESGEHLPAPAPDNAG
jgi:hypothetical protein